MTESHKKTSQNDIDWLAHARAREAAVQTMKEYASLHGLELRRFYEARTRLVKSGALSIAT